jgi:hypothetical protein
LKEVRKLVDFNFFAWVNSTLLPSQSMAASVETQQPTPIDNQTDETAELGIIQPPPELKRIFFFSLCNYSQKIFHH